MKGMTKFFTISAMMALPVGIAILFSCADSEPTLDNKPIISSFTNIPVFPNKVEFAGEIIDLDRYDMRERYDRELTGFSYTHNLTSSVVKRANRLFPIIEPILKEEGIPDDFKYLAVIESSLNERAVSPVKASGLWQIMETTGKELGLEISPGVDERYNIEKATRAAAKYLKRAYDKYGNWMTAAASYNAGMGRISNELDKQGGEDVFDLSLVEETSRYPFRMMAMKEVMSNPYKYGFVIKSDQLHKQIRTKDVKVNYQIDDLNKFAQSYGLTYAQLKDFNPWLRDRKLPNKSGKEYIIKIPNKEDLYYTKNDNIKVHNKAWVVD